MGMNNKLKAVVALAILGAASQAHAAIDPGSTGNGELFLSIFDTGTGTSYTKDLGVKMDSFIAVGNTAGTSLNFNYASDANYATFLAAAGGAGNTNIQWVVLAADSTGSGLDGQRYLSTSANTLAQVKTQGNGNVSAGFANVNNFFSAVNSQGTHATQADGSSFDSLGTDPGAYAGGNPGPAWGGKAQGWSAATSGGLNSSMNFFYITPSNTSPASKVSAYEFGDAASSSMGTWAITSVGTLAYNVSAVPVPAALWLLGSALVGLVGVARRKVA